MAKRKEWTEAELVLTFKLNRITSYETPLLKEWLAADKIVFSEGEKFIFDSVYPKVIEKITGWSEEDLKMKFISFVLELGRLTDFDKFVTFFDKKIAAVVEGISLSVKSDFMMATGFMNLYKNPYFHFQEYKPQLNPTGEPMAQLLQAFLIGQEKNQNEKPIYGLEVIGASWRFVVIHAKDYCISKTYDCTDKDDLMQIIAILRKFKEILETRLLD
jgi:hypothetical protein